MTPDFRIPRTLSIRLDGDQLRMLYEISVKPTSSAQTAVEVLLLMRRATIKELKGIFTRDEIIALLSIFKPLVPNWQIMCNTDVLVAIVQDAEKHAGAISLNAADPDALIEKLKPLTAGQATILQLELWSFWNRDKNMPVDVGKFVTTLL